MTHFEHQKASKIALANRVRKQYARKPRRIRWRGRVADKNAMWQRAHLARHHHSPCATGTREACNSPYKTDPPPLISSAICLSSRLF